MVSFKFKTLARAALATAMVVGAQLASAQVAAGDTIVLNQTNYASGSTGGAFTGTVVGSGAASFVTFCLEKNETVTLGQNAYVGSVTDHTIGGYGTDAISSETAWLFTQYSNNAAGFTINSTTTNAAMQNAFWYLENERDVTFSSLNSTAQNWVTQAQNAVSSHAWTGTGNAKVINLYADANHTIHAQDQLVMMAPVPEPETFAMLLAGLGVMGFVARRRKSTAV